MGQWIIILAVALIGQFVSDLISFPIPKTIIASIILFLLLEFKVVKADYFKEVLAGCKKHLAFLFLPVGVGIMTQLNSRPIMDYVKVLFIMVLSTFLIMLFTGKLADIIILDTDIFEMDTENIDKGQQYNAQEIKLCFQQ